MHHYRTMDARQLRTRQALAHAILELATEKPLSEISVTDLARAADITRPTFYAHATSPGDLLARVLDDELQQLRRDFSRLSETTPALETVSLEAPERALVAHVFRHAALYRRNLRLRLPDPVRDMLTDNIEGALADHLGRHPTLAPTDEGLTAQERQREFAVYAAIAASGTVAALETWLRGPDPLDQDWAVSAILRGSPAWWQRVTREDNIHLSALS
ncbi:MAG: hypothetical protein JWQ43_2033 [Glaciihabitans sp.]|nr:hypothetical protein [Glaciihabitans sp.]